MTFDDESIAQWSVWEGDLPAPLLSDPDLDRYVTRSFLGRGGMGVVELAWDRRLHREVAIKRPREDAPQGSGRLLLQEARLVAHLQHPGILAVHDLGLDDHGVPWVAMDLARGRTLYDALEQEAGLRWVRTVLAIAEAVAYAHSVGVVHRDLKPANVFVGAHGEVQVSDWGLAAVLEGFGWDTMLGDRVPVGAGGTPGYRAPEQATGVMAAPTADVYSLGAMLWELMAGDTPPKPLPEDAPPELVAIARKALSERPEDRYPDAAALAEDLGHWLDGRRVRAHTYRRTEVLRRWVWRWRAPLTVAAGASVALLVLGVVSYEQTRRERDRAVAAEQRTRAALDEADRALSVALVSRAQESWQRGLVAEAEVLAAEAYRRDPTPEVVGLLAGLAVEPHPESAGTEALPPGCRGALAPEGVLCTTNGDLGYFPSADAPPRWTVPNIDVRGMQVSDDYVDVAYFDEQTEMWVERRALVDGAVLSRLHATPYYDRVIVDGDYRAVVVEQSAEVWRGDAPVREFETCPGSVARGWDFLPGTGRLVVSCADGALVTLADGVVTTAPNRWPGVVAVAGLADGQVVLGTIDGKVSRVEARTGEASWEGHWITGPVGRFCVDPGLQTVIAMPVTGNPTAIDASSGAIRAMLPADKRSDCRFSSPQEVRMLGSEVAHWRLPAPQPAAVDAGAGLTWASRDEHGWVATTGQGVVARWSPAGEPSMLRWQDRVLKGGVLLGGGDVVVASLTDPGWVRLHGDEREVLQPTVDRLFRRVGVLGSGALWGLAYSRTVEIRTPDGSTFIAEGAEDVRGVDGRTLPDGSGFVALDQDRGDVWLVRDGPPFHARLLVAGSESSSVAANAELLFMGKRDGVEAVALDGSEPRWSVPVPSAVLDVAVSPSGKRIALGLLDGTVELRDAADGARVAVLRGHTQRVASVEFEDEEHLITAGWDGRARRWHVGIRPDPEAIFERWGLDLDAVLGL
ncbi:MAG: hypothetical protein EP330_29065 [Deltaproteobacteria bacterium]|nr:MAG: hypothetical protein EP330_29065 [Deltaproteobacteria bacterium]